MTGNGLLLRYGLRFDSLRSIHLRQLRSIPLYLLIFVLVVFFFLLLFLAHLLVLVVGRVLGRTVLLVLVVGLVVAAIGHETLAQMVALADAAPDAHVECERERTALLLFCLCLIVLCALLVKRQPRHSHDAVAAAVAAAKRALATHEARAAVFHEERQVEKVLDSLRERMRVERQLKQTQRLLAVPLVLALQTLVQVLNL